MSRSTRVTEAMVEGDGWSRSLFGSLSRTDRHGHLWVAWLEPTGMWFSRRIRDKLEPSIQLSMVDYLHLFSSRSTN